MCGEYESRPNMGVLMKDCGEDEPDLEPTSANIG